MAAAAALGACSSPASPTLPAGVSTTPGVGVGLTITACGTISGSGTFTLTGDLQETLSSCLRFDHNVAAELDCQGHNAIAISLEDVQSFSVRNCRMRGLIVSGSDVIVDSNEVLGYVDTLQCTRCIFKHNTLTFAPVGTLQWRRAELDMSFGDSNQVLDNIIDGGWNGDMSTYQAQGADNGILFTSEAGLVIEGNTIRNVYGAGIEPAPHFGSPPITAAIRANTIVHAGYTGIGGSYVSGWRDSEFSGNTVSDSPSLLHFEASGAGPRYGVTMMTFVNNRIANNTFHNPVNLPPLYGGGMPPDLFIDYVSTHLPYTVSGNVVQDNVFGTAYFRPMDGFIDGGGNLCRRGSSAPLDCSGRLGILRTRPLFLTPEWPLKHLAPGR